MNNKTLSMVMISGLIGVGGFAAGYVANTPAQTEEVPPVSATGLSDDVLERVCLESEAFANLSDVENEQPFGPISTARATAVTAAPLSDRGVICEVSGAIETVREGRSLQSKAFREFFLVSLPSLGSELVTEKFARELQASRAIHDISSNEGRNAEAIEVPKIGAIEF